MLYVNRYSLNVKKQPWASVLGTRVNDERSRLLRQDYKIIIRTPDSVSYNNNIIIELHPITGCCCSGS